MTGLVKCLVFDEIYAWGKERRFYRLSKDFNMADAMHFAKHGYEGMPLLANIAQKTLEQNGRS